MYQLLALLLVYCVGKASDPWSLHYFAEITTHAEREISSSPMHITHSTHTHTAKKNESVRQVSISHRHNTDTDEISNDSLHS